MNILPYLYDFASILFENRECRKRVRRVILFGSAATGEHDRESDIDIFIDVPKGSAKAAQKAAKDAVKRFSAVSESKWSLSGISLPISPVVGDLKEARWKEMRSELISTGILLYGKFEAMPEKLSHWSLFTYSLATLTQKKKMKFLRKLFGYRTAKGRKEYVQEGLLAGVGGKRLASNSIIIPLEKSREIQKFFTSFNVTPEIREVWMK